MRGHSRSRGSQRRRSPSVNALRWVDRELLARHCQHTVSTLIIPDKQQARSAFNQC